MTTDEDTVRRLRSAMATATRDHHLDPDLGTVAGRRLDASRGRRGWLVAACVLGIAALAALLAVVRTTHDRAPATGPSCAVSEGPLPPWARGGFTPGADRAPHVVAADRQILAVLFAYPLRVHPPAGRHNKVLWVARQPGAPLVVRAYLASTGRHVSRRLAGGTGPSYLNLPAPGCWQLTLSWSGHHDTLSVPFRP